MAKSKSRAKPKHRTQPQTKPSPKTPDKRTPVKTQKPQRGTLLTIALVLVILHGFFMFAVYWATMGNMEARARLGHWASWAWWPSPMSSPASLCGIGRSGGIYLYAVATVAKTVVTLVMTGSLMMVFAGLAAHDHRRVHSPAAHGAFRLTRDSTRKGFD